MLMLESYGYVVDFVDMKGLLHPRAVGVVGT